MLAFSAICMTVRILSITSAGAEDIPTPKRSKAYGEKKKGSKNPLASLAASDYSSEVDNIVKPVE